MLKKEIDTVKNSLASLQKDHKEMLKEKKQLEKEYEETKNEVTKTLELNSKDIKIYNDLLNSKMEKLNLESSIAASSYEKSIYKLIMNTCVKQAEELELFRSETEKNKKDFLALINVKESIELLLEEKEKEYLEKIRECEAVTGGQTGMINSMEFLLKDLEGKMDCLINENQRRKNSLMKNRQEDQHKDLHNLNNHSIDSIILQKSKSRESDYNSDEFGPSDLIPFRCLQSYTNPISLFTDEERIKHQSPKRWVEDDEVSTCQQPGCDVNFNLWNRRHHCRRCGYIFCNTHSAYSMLLFPDGSEDWGGVWSRVCGKCFKNT
ncbi:684_t:CDS:2 [Entrophospora sp. SA101]|nr:684_t:CDS:2 [Entrophospora sp. SA101]